MTWLAREKCETISQKLFTGSSWNYYYCISHNNPMLKDQVGECTVCGKKPEEDCKMPDIKPA